MSRFVELRTGKDAFHNRYLRQIINADTILLITDRPGYDEPMVNVKVAGSARDLICYEAYDELAERLTSRAAKEGK